MRKVLLPIAKNKFPASVFEFIRQLNEADPVLLIGIFLREIVYLPEPALDFYGGMGMRVYFSETEALLQEDLNKQIAEFTVECKKHDIEYRVHNDTDDLTIYELKKESRFADLLIISEECLYPLSESTEHSERLKSILHLSECPILIIPQKFEFPSSVIVAYNGTESSVYALKQFSYVLKELCNIEAVVVYEALKEDKTMPDEELIRELSARHFSKLTFLTINKDFSRLSTWLNRQTSPLLITGSYGRTGFSEIFKKSFADNILRKQKLPIFFAHK